MGGRQYQARRTAFGLMIAEDVFSGIALHKFGTRDLNGDQMI
jgi:hypothetical protein